MKNAEEWDKFFCDRYNAREHPEWKAKSSFEMLSDMCNHIQLDAFKAGAEWAAQFCEDQTFAAGGKRDLNEISYDTACIDCQKIIQEEASNLKEIPK